MPQASAIVMFRGGFLRAEIHEGFVQYYRALFNYSTHNIHKKEMFGPRHGCHITIFNPKFHNTNLNPNIFNGRKVWFTYNPEHIHRGGKIHTGYYLGVESPQIEDIRAELGIKNGGNLHISLFTNKHTL